jgi:predicted fused transcriptional regulator/phosphomethylpyrimidine kinase/predicted transcriptional regulator
MRQLVAVRLRAEGLSQSRIALALGTSQASVSMYLSAPPAKAYSDLSLLSISKADADIYSARLASAASRGAKDGVGALSAIWTGILGSGAACGAHRALYPSLADCDFCVRAWGGQAGAKAQAVSEVSEAVRILEASPSFVNMMPEVSVNVACAAGEATSPSDVVAIPGRIVKVRGRAKAVLTPEAGASVHMANVLLLARTARPDFRACINLRYDGKVAAVLRRMGLRVLSVGARPRGASDDPTVDALRNRLLSQPGRFDAVVDEGGSGIEPNLYLFAAGAQEVATLAVTLAEACSAG